jgi:hypothetical protein
MSSLRLIKNRGLNIVCATALKVADIVKLTRLLIDYFRSAYLFLRMDWNSL